MERERVREIRASSTTWWCLIVCSTVLQCQSPNQTFLQQTSFIFLCTDNTFLNRFHVSHREIKKKNSCKQGLPEILFRYLSVSFLFISSAPLIIGITVVLRYPIFSNSNFPIFIFTDFIILFNWYISIYYWAIGLMSRVFADGLEDRGSNPRSSHTKDSKNGTWCHLA